MTKDEIFKLAEKAGFGCCWEYADLECGLIWWSDERPIDEELLRFAALVAEAERESCAKIAEDHQNDCYDGDIDWHEARRITAAIRARGEE